MSTHMATFEWKSDSKDKIEFELNSNSLEKENEQKLFKEYQMSKSPGLKQAVAKKQQSIQGQAVRPLTESEISNQIDKQMNEDFVDDLN